MVPTTPSPLTWTLRLKYNKGTTLLHVDPLQSFTSIKAELLRALHQIYPNGALPDGTTLPASSQEVLLAKPVDVNDHSQGWTRLAEDEAKDDEDLETTKSKSSKKRKNDAESSLSCPKGAGLKEGSVLAYKFRSGQDDEGLGLEDERWDVVIPNYEDSTGVTNEGDVGGLAPFEG